MSERTINPLSKFKKTNKHEAESYDIEIKDKILYFNAGTIKDWEISEIQKWDIIKVVCNKNVKELHGRFNDFRNLRELDLGEVVELNAELNSSRAIETVTGNAIEKISTFTNCKRLSNINFPKLKEIPENAFSDCINLETANIPKIAIIKKSAFKNCASLHSVDVGNNCIAIDAYAFAECGKLKNINLSNAQFIGLNSFKNCLNLQTIDLPSIKGIGKGAFNGCKNLISVNLHNIKYLDPTAFDNCINLDRIIIDNVEYYLPQNINQKFSIIKNIATAINEVYETKDSIDYKGRTSSSALKHKSNKLKKIITNQGILYTDYNLNKKIEQEYTA